MHRGSAGPGQGSYSRRVPNSASGAQRLVHVHMSLKGGSKGPEGGSTLLLLKEKQGPELPLPA